MGDYVSILGGLTVGSYLGAMLYMLEIVQLVSYINYFWQRDRFLIKLGVVLCFIIDTLGTAAVFTWVFMYDVVHWGDVPYLGDQSWPLPTCIFCTTTVGALVQTFLIYRYYALSSQRVVSFLLGLFVLTALSGGVAVGIFASSFVSYADRDKIALVIMLWLVSSAMADVLIAISLVITLTRASGRTTIRSTRTLLSRLILTAIQSGTVTSIFAIIVVVTIVTRPTTNDSAYISFSLGHVYNLSMLLNLNLRRRLESRPCSCGRTAPGVSVTNGAVMGAPVGTPAAGPSRGPGELGRSRGDAPAEVYRLSRLHVHQTRSEVHLDDEDLATVLKAEGYRDYKDSAQV